MSIGMNKRFLKQASCRLALLLAIDAAFIFYTFFCPVHVQDGLSILLLTVFCAIFSLIVFLFLLLFKKYEWATAVLVNAIVLAIAIVQAASYSTMLAYE